MARAGPARLVFNFQFSIFNSPRQNDSVAPAETVLVLDFGSQYTQLIARRIRDLSVYSVVHPFDHPPARIREMAPKAIILSGGPQSVYSESAPICSREVFELGV